MLKAPPKPPPLPDRRANKEKRIKWDLCTKDKDQGTLWRHRIYERCRNDFKFWANTYCFFYDEHGEGDQKKQPLALYDFQAEMADVIIENVFRCAKNPHERWNAGADKARKMTATFTALLISQWFAQFHGISTIITSKDDREVDIQEDMNSPFERLRWQIEQQYNEWPWLFPGKFNPHNKQCSKTKLINFQNGGQLTGRAPTGKALRQGRALIWLADEFAFVDKDREVWEAASGTVKVRLVFSTPNGPNCLFYELVQGEMLEDGTAPPQFHLFELDWWKNPDYAEGLYYKPDGTLSSPYFDAVCAANSKQVIAKEYLRDHNEALGGKVFPMFNRMSIVDDLMPDSLVNTIYRCWDPGLNFGITWCQKDRYGRQLVLAEYFQKKENVGKETTLLKHMAEMAISLTEKMFNDFNVVDIGDPYASRQQISMQEKTEYEMLADLYQIRVQSAFMRKMPSHERKTRRVELMSELMTTDITTDDGDTTPSILIHPRCKITVKAITERYRYTIDDGEVTDEIPDNHPYTEMMDCVGMTAIKFYDTRKNNGAATKPARKKLDWRPSYARMRATRHA